MPQTAVAVAAGSMHNRNRWTGNHPHVGLPNPLTYIDILVIQEVALVEPFYCRKVRSTEQHEHAGNPVSEKTWGIGGYVISSIMSTHGFSDQSTQPWEVPNAVLYLP